MVKIPNLDVLRFVLASLVIVFHLPQLCRNQGLPYYLDAPIFNKGIEAVYMFFELSGFLIIRQIYLAKQKERFSIRKFYVRRILRIFPLYYFIVVFGFVFYQLILPLLSVPFENNYDLSTGLILTTFFLPNVFAFAYEPGGILEVLWSIGIEEQFYLLIAPLLFLLKKNRMLLTLMIFTLIYFVIYHIEPWLILKRFKVVYFFLFFGGVIAILEEKRKLEFLKKSKIIPLTIVFITFIYFVTNFLKFDVLWLNNFLTTLLFGLFIHSIGFNNFGISIKNKMLNYMGSISYGIYMLHVLALNATVFLFLKIDMLKNLNNFGTILLIHTLTFTITIIMAHFSYVYFEKIFLKLKNKFRE